MLNEREALRARLKQIDINQTEPQLLATFIERAMNIGENVKADEEALENILDNIINCLIENGILKLAKVSQADALEIANKPFASIDGSLCLGGSLHGYYYFPISAVCVFFENWQDVHPIVQYSPETDIFTFHAPDNRIASLYASLKMLILETNMLSEAFGKDIKLVMIDGPIIDPPQKYDLPAYEELLNLRITSLAHLENEKVVIGVIKRVSGRLFINHILQLDCIKRYQRNLRKYTDRVLLDAIFTKILLNETSIPYIEPIELNGIPAYEDYKNRDLKILTSFTQARVDTPPLRYEFFHLNEKECERIAVVLSSLTLPGQRYPLPIEIAHEKSLIRQGLAETLFDEILTHFSSETSSTLSKILRVKNL